MIAIVVAVNVTVAIVVAGAFLAAATALRPSLGWRQSQPPGVPCKRVQQRHSGAPA